MQIFLFIFTLVLAVGCGHQIDPQLTPYVHDFEQAARAAGTPIQVNSISIRFGEVEGGDEHSAVCNQGFGYSEIVLQAQAWAEADETERHAILYHEIGHCVLGRSHVGGSISKDGLVIPLSLMNADGVPSVLFEREASYYVKELLQSP